MALYIEDVNQDKRIYTKGYCMLVVIDSVFTMENYAIGQLLRSEGSTFYSMIGMIADRQGHMMILEPGNGYCVLEEDYAVLSNLAFLENPVDLTPYN